VISFEKDQNGKIDESKMIGKKFGVISLPTKILIDKNGMIIGRYGGTGGENDIALDNKLKEIFK
jgi:thioredoxin-related protein